MTGMDILEGLSFIDESFIAEADAEPVKRKTSWMKWASLAACLCILITAAFAFVRMGGGAESESAQEAPAATAPGLWGMETEAAMPEAAPEEAPEEEYREDTIANLEEKLIRTVYMDAESLSVQTLIPKLDSLLAEAGGYYERRFLERSATYEDGSHEYYADLVLRVPEDRLDDFLTQIGDLVNVIRCNEETENVTLQYADTKSRVEALETEQKRLLELLETVETMEDLLKIEERLTNVRWELENYASALRDLDNQVRYSTIYLCVWDVEKPTVLEERSVFQKIGDGFTENAQTVGDGLVDTFIWIVASIPYLLPLGLLAGVILLAVFILKRRKRK